MENIKQHDRIVSMKFVFRRLRWHSAQSEPSSRNSSSLIVLFANVAAHIVLVVVVVTVTAVGGCDHSKKMTGWFDEDCLPAHKNRTIPGSLAS